VFAYYVIICYNTLNTKIILKKQSHGQIISHDYVRGFFVFKNSPKGRRRKKKMWEPEELEALGEIFGINSDLSRYITEE